MKFINTPKLKTHIEHLYEKVRSVAEAEGIFKPLDLHFCDTILGTGRTQSDGTVVLRQRNPYNTVMPRR